MEHPGPLLVAHAARPSLRDLLLRAAFGLVLLAGVGAAYCTAIRPATLAADYFFGDDLWLLLAGAAGLALLAPFASRGGALKPFTPWQATGIITFVTLVAWAGCSLVMERFGPSRDEDMAEFAAAYFQHGQFGLAIPVSLRPLKEAMLPLYATIHGGAWWASSYYPVNSALRALAGWATGDRWLAGPLLLAFGLVGIWRAAHRLWPGRAAAPTIALLLAASSVQLLANAMSPFAMTAQFALEAWWLAALLRGDTRGHVAAALIGVLATGTHQTHFHAQFVFGPLLWLWVSGQRRAAVAQALAVAAAWAFWADGYRDTLLAVLLGPGVAPAGGDGLVARILQVDPVPSLTRFVAWQNLLLAPLALVGARAALRDGARPATWGLAISCAIGLVLTVDGAHGFGCRYLTGLIPYFCLLATDGWLRLEQHHGRSLGGALLWASVAVTGFVAVPFALWRSHATIHPYAAAYRLATSAPADTVLVDSRDAAFLQDIVRFRDPMARPLLLDLSKVPMAALPRLCRGRVMILDASQAIRLGIAPRNTQRDASAAGRRRAWVERAGCGVPVPVAAR